MSMKQIVTALFFTPGVNGRWGLPLLCKGAPGTAKTATIGAIAAEAGLHQETILASLRAPQDFLGLPIPVVGDAQRAAVIAGMRAAIKRAGGGDPKVSETDTDVTFSMMDYAPPSWAVRLALAGRGVCFLDEINTAPPAIQAALLRVVLEGVVGEMRLPPGIRFIAAMNPTEDAAGGWDLAPPTANRFGHFEWGKPDLEGWKTFMIGGAGTGDAPAPTGGGAAEREAQVTAAWPQHFARAFGAVSGFLSAMPQKILIQPKSGEPAASGAWPSPRTWEMATRALAGADLHGLAGEDREIAVAGFIGNGATGELMNYMAKADIPDAEKVLDGQIEFKHQPARLDRTAAVLGACAALVMQTKTRQKDRAVALWKLMSPIADAACDLVIPAASSLAKGRLGLEVPAAQVCLAKMYPVTEVAKITQGSRR